MRSDSIMADSVPGGVGNPKRLTQIAGRRHELPIRAVVTRARDQAQRRPPPRLTLPRATRRCGHRLPLGDRHAGDLVGIRVATPSGSRAVALRSRCSTRSICFMR
jgi:hypothetical protein